VLLCCVFHVVGFGRLLSGLCRGHSQSRYALLLLLLPLLLLTII
jgi:hypothetical protein